MPNVPHRDTELTAQRDRWWEALLGSLAADDDWVARGLLPVGRTARSDERLGRLFPFISMSRLCFSRSTWPFTNDCPTIEVDPTGRYHVYARPYSEPTNDDGPIFVLGRDLGPDEAVLIAAAAVPNDVEVWVRTSRR